MKLKNDDLLRLVFVWQTAQTSKLTAVNASIPHSAELCCCKSLNSKRKQVPWEAQNCMLKIYGWFSLWTLIKQMAEYKKPLTYFKI